MKSVRAAVIDCIKELGRGCVDDVTRLMARDGIPATRKQIIVALQNCKFEGRLKVVGQMPQPAYGRAMVIYAEDTPPPRKRRVKQAPIRRVSCVWELGSFA